MFSYRNSDSLGPIKLGNDLIYQTDSCKFLGLIIIDNNLKFKKHADYISSKLSKSIGIINKLNNYIPVDILQHLYNSLILPYLSYGVGSWMGAPQYVRNRINVLQKKSH